MTEAVLNSIPVSREVDTRLSTSFLSTLRGRLRWGLDFIKEVSFISLASITGAAIGAFGLDYIGWSWAIGGLIGAGVGSFLGTKSIIDRERTRVSSLP